MNYVEILVGVSVLVVAAFSFFFIRSKMALRRENEKKLGREPTRKMETIKGEEAKNLIKNVKKG